MVTRVGAGRSNKLEDSPAVKDAFGQALKNLSGYKPDMVFIFTTDS